MTRAAYDKTIMRIEREIKSLNVHAKFLDERSQLMKLDLSWPAESERYEHMRSHFAQITKLASEMSVGIKE